MLSAPYGQDICSHAGDLRRDSRLTPMPVSPGPHKAAPTKHTRFSRQLLLPTYYKREVNS